MLREYVLYCQSDWLTHPVKKDEGDEIFIYNSKKKKKMFSGG